MLPLREKLKKIPRLFLTRKESRSVVINMTGSSMNDSRHKWKGSHQRKQVGFMLLGVLVPGVGVKVDCIHLRMNVEVVLLIIGCGSSSGLFQKMKSLKHNNKLRMAMMIGREKVQIILNYLLTSIYQSLSQRKTMKKDHEMDGEF